MGGRLSADFRWEKQATTNVTVSAGTFPNGTTYSILAGSGLEEGVDGDLAMTVMPGWQVVGSFYAGHNRDQNNNPISGSWDNSLGLFTRYDFHSTSVLRGLSIGGGYSKIGARWISTTGIINGAALETLYTRQTNEIKVVPTNMMNAFMNYNFNKHFGLSVNCANVLNKAFPLDVQQISITDLSPPRTFRFEADYKF
jgi:iron complex outermembrane receptor protein